MESNGATLNRQVAWSGMAVGAALGMLMGLWSFDGPMASPSFLGDYGSNARRLARLGHIACFGLGFINLFLARELPLLPKRFRRLAARAMNLGNIGLPLVLLTASVWEPSKYLLPLPAACVLLALTLTARGIRRA